MDRHTARELASSARVGRLATVAADGMPHIVPVCFTLVGDVVYNAVDHKPKTDRRLRRITNVLATGVACLLVDEYDDADWTHLWWVRLDGHARVVEVGPERTSAVDALVAKYRQYTEVAPADEVLAVDVRRYSGWSAAHA